MTRRTTLAGIVALGVLVAACSGSDATSTTTTSTPPTTTSMTATTPTTTATTTTTLAPAPITELGLLTAMTPSGADFAVTFDPIVWEPNGPGTCGDGSPCWDNPTVESDMYVMPAASTASFLVWDSTGNIAEQTGSAAHLYDYAFGTYCATNPTVCPEPPAQFSPVWIITHDGAGTILSVVNQYVP